MTSVTIITTRTYDTDTDTDTGNGNNYGNYGKHQPQGDDSDDIGGQGDSQDFTSSLEAALEGMNLPDSMKDMLRKVLSGSSGESLPSEASAVDTMQNFQNQNKDKLGLLSYDQMKDIASGKTDQINGVDIPDNVRDAAKTYTANNGALFDKVESATTGKHDSLLSAGDADRVDRSQLSQQPTVAGTGPDSFMRACANGHISPNEPEQYDAVKTMGRFQKENDIKLISYDQMKDIASGKTTEMNGKPIPDDVKEAANAYVANHGALFDKVESATDGKHDSELSAGDATQAVDKGMVDVPLMSDKRAVSAMEDFQKNGGPRLISKDQMDDIASGKTTSLNGKEITPEVQAAAKAYVANNGALFDKMEAATDGKHDSELGAGDPEQARNKGFYLSSRAPDSNNRVNIGPDDSLNINIDLSGNGQRHHRHHDSYDNADQPPAYDRYGNGYGNGDGNGHASGAGDTQAVEAMEKFQKNGGPGLISKDQMDDIASGKITSLGGKEITPDVKAAAQAYVANNGALFDKIEAATDGKHDSELGAGDPGQARKKGLTGMSDTEAVDTIKTMQNDPKQMMRHGMMPGSTISVDQMQEMASKGTLNGVPVDGDVKAAAKHYMADHGALFDKVESATNGKHDSQLSGGDAQKAEDDNLIDA